MKLSKALKLKNKLAGEVNKLQRLIQEENIQIDNNERKFSTKVLFDRLIETQAELAELKSKIAKANAPIYDAIYTMAELKNRIAFLEGLNTKEGSFMESRFLSADSAKPTIYQAEITKKDVTINIAAMEKLIEELQDQIDEFNSSTHIKTQEDQVKSYS